MNTVPYISFDVNTWSYYLVKPRRVHLIVAKLVMRCPKGTIVGIYYGRDHEYILYGYMDLDWVGSAINRKRTSRGCYFVGSAMISWFSKRQSSVALGTTEVEYIASYSSCCEVIWIWKLISGLFDM